MAKKKTTKTKAKATKKKEVAKNSIKKYTGIAAIIIAALLGLIGGVSINADKLEEALNTAVDSVEVKEEGVTMEDEILLEEGEILGDDEGVE